MKSYYEEDTIREIESRLDIIDIVSDTVKLTRKGNRYWGLCPFHQEKTASFTVTPERNMFYCFGCHTGGDMFTFVMKLYRISFREAVEMLAARAGIAISKKISSSPALNHKQKVIEINKAAAEYFSQSLSTHPVALNYLSRRKITPEIIEHFQIGYAPDNWNGLSEYLLKKGFSEEYIKSARLINRSNSNNTFYDYFRNRIMFPVFDTSGNIIGFGGRVLSNSMPKYLNTPETDVFLKGRNLYGLYQARESIRVQGQAILVEGYIDCIKLHQAGINNVVASLGTALTQHQAKILRRYANEVLIIYDGDEAGQREASRAMQVLLDEDLKVYIVVLPDNRDPDEYVDLYGKKEFLQYIKNNKVTNIEYKINNYIRNHAIHDLKAKVELLDLVGNDILNLTSEIEKDFYIKNLARKLQIEEGLVLKEINKQGRKLKGIKRNKTQINRDNINYGIYSIEEKIIAQMVIDEQFFDYIEKNYNFKIFSNNDYYHIIDTLSKLKGKGNKMQLLGNELNNEKYGPTLAKIMLLADEGYKLEPYELHEFLSKIEKKRRKENIQDFMGKINDISENGGFNRIIKLILDYNTFLIDAREGGTK